MAVDVISLVSVRNDYSGNFQPLEVVSRYRDPQPQVVENLKCKY